MPKMTWFRAYTEIRTDPKMQAITLEQFRLWIFMLCLARESRMAGVIGIAEGVPYPLDALARCLYVDEGTLIQSLRLFESLKMIRQTDSGIAIEHWLERQYDKPSDQPEAVKERVQRHRNANETPMKRGCNAIDTDTDTDTDTEDHNTSSPSQQKAKQGEYTPEFEEFWSAYPKRVEKRAAFKAWNARLKSRTPPSDMITAARNYAAKCTRMGTSAQYIKHPATFLGPNEPYKDHLMKEAPDGPHTPSKPDLNSLAI